MPTYSHIDLKRELLGEFPELRDEFELHSGLPYIQMGRFAAFTQAAKGRADWALYGRCIALADRFFANADPDLENAFLVAYLEHIDFDGPRGPQAWGLLTPRLQAAWQRITEQNARHSALPQKKRKRRA